MSNLMRLGTGVKGPKLFRSGGRGGWQRSECYSEGSQNKLLIDFFMNSREMTSEVWRDMMPVGKQPVNTWKFQMNAVADGDRLAKTAAVKESILAEGGFVTDFHEFSNVSVCLMFELSADRAGALAERWRGAGLVLAAFSERLLAELNDGCGVLAGSLQIAFVHDEQDLKVRIPAVLG